MVIAGIQNPLSNELCTEIQMVAYVYHIHSSLAWYFGCAEQHKNCRKSMGDF
jgi:hypothetical protein